MTKVKNTQNNAVVNYHFTEGVPFLAKVKTGKNTDVVITIYFNIEKKSNIRKDTFGHVWVGDKHCGMFRHNLSQPIPCWYPDPKGDGINGAWSYNACHKHPKLEVIAGKPDSFGAAILRAEQLFIQKLNFGLAFNNILAKPVCNWKRQDFENIGVTNSGFLDKVLAACEKEKPQKLRELVALKCGGFGQKSYEKAAEILGRLEVNMGYKCRAL